MMGLNCRLPDAHPQQKHRGCSDPKIAGTTTGGAIDVLECARCKGRMQVIAALSGKLTDCGLHRRTAEAFLRRGAGGGSLWNPFTPWISVFLL
jgi:hypothetical protein